ncbi:MAG: PKD domain-containing protein [Halobacteriota archaeon]
MNVKLVSVLVALLIAAAVLQLHVPVSAQDDDLRVTVNAPAHVEKSESYTITVTVTTPDGTLVPGRQVKVQEFWDTPAMQFQYNYYDAQDKGDGTYIVTIAGYSVSQLRGYIGETSGDFRWISSDPAYTSIGTPPVPVAGDDVYVIPYMQTPLDASQSYDPEGHTPLAYRWFDQTNGSGQFIGDQQAATVDFVPTDMHQRTSILQAWVWNSIGAWGGWDEVTVIANTPPAAVITGESANGDSMVLNGAGSHDADNDPLTYAWSLVAKPDGSAATVTPDVSNPASATFKADLQGTYTAQLTVNDGYQSATSALTINANIIPQGGIADAGTTTSADTGQQVWELTWYGSTLKLTLTTPSGVTLDGRDHLELLPANVKYEETPTSARYLVDNPEPGTYTTHVTAIDVPTNGEHYLISQSTKPAPVANAGFDQTTTVKSAVTLDGSMSYDPDGHPITYAWTLTDKPHGSKAQVSSGTSAQPTFTPDKEGAYKIQLVVTDSNGIHSTVSATTVTATSAKAPKPPKPPK